ncbi:DNA polymerase III subunit gamma/tau [Caballeronia sp. LZ035]|uniref:DNA polymerase III subunit gamma/tau n=1 Tax=Caballeronia sp. LZ035 TaxID=3038568 RepID=UPI00286490C1|nr:DNA polymerase III subunit gamma/tau [Caballeronia sp. LZ035]MDR5757318.1 DNA polymerase III subunit gamma/tau [Caballeronia sp. LZ035]
MTYQVLARKWRPKSFESLVGQEHVVRALTHALDGGRLHHAYLFTGTRGVGKTTLSRIFAKALNCETGVTSKPCGVCRACREIDEGRFVDYVEMDAASNRGVDEMAALLERAVYAPVDARFKVYMIDEVHMLTNHAFNAMLKTLEEPPSHVKFILATTDPQKIPVTVLSRCLQFNLKQMPAGHIVGHLENILKEEGIAFEQQALRLLSRAADGSMRDALSLTDQAIAYSANQVTEEAVRGMLGALDQSYLIRLLDALAAGDGALVLDIADEMALRSLSFSTALQDLASLLHRVAWAQFAPSSVLDEWPEAADIRRFAEMLSAEQVQLFYQIATVGRGELGLAPDEYAGFTMTLLRMLAFEPAGGPGGGGVAVSAPAPARPVRGAALAGAMAERAVSPAPVLKATGSVETKAVAPAALAPVRERERPEAAASADTPTDQLAAVEAREAASVANKPVPEAMLVANKPAPEAVQVANKPVPEAVQVANKPAPEAAPVANKPVPEAVQVASKPAPEAVQVANTPSLEPVPVANKPAHEAAAANKPVLEAVPVASKPDSEAVQVANKPVPESTPVANQPVPEAAPVTNTPLPETAPVANKPLPEAARQAIEEAAPAAARASRAEPTTPRAAGGASAALEVLRSAGMRLSSDRGTRGAAAAEAAAKPAPKAAPKPVVPVPVPAARREAVAVAEQPQQPPQPEAKSASAGTSKVVPPWEDMPSDDYPPPGSEDEYFMPPDDGFVPAFDSGPDDLHFGSEPSPRTTPQPKVDTTPLPPAVPLDALGLTLEWAALAVDLPLKGVAYQLAFNSELTACDASSLTLAVPVQMYTDAAHVAKLKAALAEKLGRALEVNVTVGPARRTAAALDAAARARRQQEAEQEITQDPFVQSLIRDFGASIVQGSIKPIAATGANPS